MFRRGLGQPALFAIIYTSVASAIYFSLGVVAQRALGLTPAVYLLAGVFFVLASMTYVEGASLHQDRGGATVFARYAFNELMSFVAGWMILLDYIILIAVTSFSATNYLAAFYGPLGSGTPELLLCFGIVAVTALPVVGNATSLGRNFLDAPMIGIAESFEADWLANTLKYVIAAVAAVTLIAAANSAMMGLSRLAYSLSTNRQIPSAVGRLHPTRATPYIVIAIAAILAAALTVPQDLELMVGIFAFGALLGLTIAHLSLVVLRFKEPNARRPYRIPLSVRARGADVPLPAVLGALLSAAVWVGLVV